MKKASKLAMRIMDYLTELTAKGMAYFTKADIEQTLATSPRAIQPTLWRLKQKHIIAEPVRGFYLNITPEYRILGCLPPDHFIDSLMRYLKIPYYIGLLSAAEYHGASHHKPQQFQVILPQAHRPIRCGEVSIAFINKKHMENTPTQTFTAPQGSITVSTAEATAMDLVSYPHRSGGMENVLTVLSELTEAMNPNALAQLAKQATHNITWIQRLGFLLDTLQASHLSDVLFEALKQYKPQKALLIGSNYHKNAPNTYNTKWKLIINAELELEL